MLSRSRLFASAARCHSQRHSMPATGIMVDVMGPQLAIDRTALRAFCERHHIARLAVFGSALREDFRRDSDIDLLVEFDPDHVPGLAFVAMERELSGLLQGRRVDLVTPKFLNPANTRAGAARRRTALCRRRSAGCTPRFYRRDAAAEATSSTCESNEMTGGKRVTGS